MSAEIRIALVGFGAVGQGLAQVLFEQKELIASSLGRQIVVDAVADQCFGILRREEGIPPQDLLQSVQEAGSFSHLWGYQENWDVPDMIASTRADILVELSYTNLKTGEPASSYIRQALMRKMHVVTSNKGPAALHYGELDRTARQNGVRFEVEGTVMSGTPAIRLAREALFVTGISSLRGILNGTSNYMLTRMDEGLSYEEALVEAQKAGYAEADPSGDVEGFDTAGKLIILARLLFGVEVALGEVERKGITGLKVGDIISTRQQGCRWKLIGSIEKLPSGKLHIAVCPQQIDLNDPLSRIDGASNAIQFQSNLLGQVLLVGPGAGKRETAAAILEDIAAIYR